MRAGMVPRSIALGVTTLLAGGLAIAQPAPVAAEELRLAATAVNLSGVGGARPEQLQIVIERWSTDEERAELLTTLVEKGERSLLDAVVKMEPRAGFIRTTTSLGWDLQYARQHELPGGGRQIVFVTDRPISFFEQREGTRSREYQFLVCQIQLGADGKGVGKLAGATKIRWDAEDGVIEMENYGQEPVRLTEVHIE